jgi:hypothetical protein
VVLVLVAVNVVVRHVGEPRWQLRLYAVTIVGLLLTGWTRSAAMKALLILVVVGLVGFVARYRDDVPHGRMSKRVAIQQVLHKLTGIRFAGDGALTTGPSPMRYAAYLDKIYARSTDVNALASKLARGCPADDRLCETARILAFVTDRVDYRSDPRGAEYVKGPQATLAAMAGDCEDKSILLISLLESIGHHTFMVFTPRHAYALDCYHQELSALLDRSVRRLGNPAASVDYLRDLAPGHDPQSLLAALRSAVVLEIGTEYCYPLESTQAGSWIGVNNGEHEYVTAFDPVSKQRVRFRN